MIGEKTSLYAERPDQVRRLARLLKFPNRLLRLVKGLREAVDLGVNRRQVAGYGARKPGVMDPLSQLLGFQQCGQRFSERESTELTSSYASQRPCLLVLVAGGTRLLQYRLISVLGKGDLSALSELPGGLKVSVPYRWLSGGTFPEAADTACVVINPALRMRQGSHALHSRPIFNLFGRKIPTDDLD